MQSSLPDPAQKYRPDIDGLRAIAVMSVVLYHAGVPFVPGGFVGVDVFFVISGYLISGIILRESAATGGFSFLRFYLRRASRILPSLALVLGTTWLLGYWVLFPEELVELGKYIMLSIGFVANIGALRAKGDYFHPVAELMPLLHLWSLAVEEQFYIFWPLILLALARKRAFLKRGLLLAMLASFAAACWAMLHAKGAAAFYLIHFRAWELILGAALAAQAAQSKERPQAAGVLGDLASVAGGAFLVVGIFGLDRHAAFPGWNALWPTLGAALLIWSGPQAILNRTLLGSRPAVWIGLISYSLYLWHWPILALIRVTHVGALPQGLAAAAVAVSIAAAALSTFYVEQPIRRWAAKLPATASRAATWRRLAPFCATVFVFLALGLATKTGKLGERPIDAALKQFKYDRVLIELECMGNFDGSRVVWNSHCGDLQTKAVVVWGDSHAAHYFSGIKRYLDRNRPGLRPAIISSGGCPPIPSVERIDDDTRCARANQGILDHLLADRQVETVIVAARFVRYARSKSFGFDTSSPVRLVPVGRGEAPSQEQLVLEELSSTVRRLREGGKRVVVLGQVPEQLVDTLRCHTRNSVKAFYQASFSCDIPVAEHKQHFGTTFVDMRKALEAFPDVCVFDPGPYFCDASACMTKIGERLLYLDSHHLSNDGSLYIGRHFDFDKCLP